MDNEYPCNTCNDHSNDEICDYRSDCEKLAHFRDKIWNIALEVAKELLQATAYHGSFHSSHEGYAVIKEELDELWEEVRKKKKNRNIQAMRKEAVQIAAMGMRFAMDICDADKANKV